METENTLQRMSEFNFNKPIDVTVVFDESDNEEEDIINENFTEGKPSTDTVVTECEQTSDSQSKLNINYVDKILQITSDYLIIILDLYQNYRRLNKNSLCPQQLKTEALRFYSKEKVRIFNLLFNTTIEILLPQNNENFVNCFIKSTFDIAVSRKPLEWDILELRALYKELLVFNKTRKRSLNPNYRSRPANMPNKHQYNINVNPPPSYVSEKRILPQPEQIYLFSGGKPGREITLKVDSKILQKHLQNSNSQIDIKNKKINKSDKSNTDKTNSTHTKKDISVNEITLQYNNYQQNFINQSQSSFNQSNLQYHNSQQNSINQIQPSFNQNSLQHNNSHKNYIKQSEHSFEQGSLQYNNSLNNYINQSELSFIPNSSQYNNSHQNYINQSQPSFNQNNLQYYNSHKNCVSQSEHSFKKSNLQYNNNQQNYVNQSTNNNPHQNYVNQSQTGFKPSNLHNNSQQGYISQSQPGYISQSQPNQMLHKQYNNSYKGPYHRASPLQRISVNVNKNPRNTINKHNHFENQNHLQCFYQKPETNPSQSRCSSAYNTQNFVPTNYLQDNYSIMDNVGVDSASNARSSVSRDSGFVSPTHINNTVNIQTIPKGYQTKSTVKLNKNHNRPAGSCIFCQKITKSKCGGCSNVFYCSIYCQKIHWFVHKPLCSTMQSNSEIQA